MREWKNGATIAAAVVAVLSTLFSPLAAYADGGGGSGGGGTGRAAANETGTHHTMPAYHFKQWTERLHAIPPIPNNRPASRATEDTRRPQQPHQLRKAADLIGATD